MCGICGYTKFNHSIEGNIEEMLEEIKHRGPDFNSKSSEKLISLAHSRLSIIDLSEKANQPFVLNNGQYSLVYNGEIYNFKKIKRKLETKFGVEFKTSSDTEVILHGYIHLKNTNNAGILLFEGYSRNIDVDSELKGINHYDNKCFYDNYKIDPSKVSPKESPLALYKNDNMLLSQRKKEYKSSLFLEKFR